MAAKKILVIEDEKAMAKALETKLKHEGFDAHAVFDGEQGVGELSKGHYDLVLCDLVMPKMDGFEFLEAMKQKKLKAKVVILSNLSQEEDKKRVSALGAIDFFTKSNTSLADIVKQVKKLIG